MNKPNMIKCENCYRMAHKTIYLGSLSDQGELFYRNVNATYTCLVSQSFTLMHDCGFTIQIESGIIKAPLSSIAMNG